MTATLTFNLDNPDDRMEHLRCINSTKMAIALFEIKNNCWRHKETLEEYKEAINAELENIDLDSLII